MKKIAGWLLIVVCSFFLLIFLIAIIAVIPGLFNHSTEHPWQTNELLTSAFGFIFIIVLLILGLKSGLKKIKKETSHQRVPYEKGLDITLNGRITYEEYRNLILGQTFNRPVFLIAPAVLIFLLISFLVNRDKTTEDFANNYLALIFLAVMLLSPVFTLYRIKKLYSSNKILHEQLEYKLQNDSMQIIGQTVNATQNWSHFYKIKETPKFFLFYQGEMIATLVKKEMFSEPELAEFKDFIRSLNVKVE